MCLILFCAVAGAQKEERVIVLRRPRRNMSISHNWALFYYHFYKDHARPNLLWNYKARRSSSPLLSPAACH